MTEAMPFLQKAILLSYDPRLFGGEFFALRAARVRVRMAPQGSTFGPAKGHKEIPASAY